MKDYLLKPISRSELAGTLQSLNEKDEKNTTLVHEDESLNINIKKITDLIGKESGQGNIIGIYFKCAKSTP